MKEIIMVIAVIFMPLGIGILLLTGKINAADAISGYNTMSKKRKEKYDEKALSHFLGWILIIFCLGFIIFFTTVRYFEIEWLKYCLIALIFVFLFANIYARTSKRFRKRSNDFNN